MRTEKTYNLFIWKTNDWTYLFLEDAFKHDDVNLQWLTGFELEFHTDDEAEQSLDDLFDGEGYDFYIQYLERNRPNDVSYNDRCDMVRDEKDSDYDDSFCNYDCVSEALEYASEKEEIDYTCTNCIGCGRHFNDENVKTDYYEYYIPKNLKLLQKLYKEYEK